MTITEIIAFLSFLSAFNVPTQTVEQIRLILMPGTESAAPVVLVPVVQTAPIVPDAPVYFGGASQPSPAVSEAAPAATPPVASSLVVDTGTPPSILSVSVLPSDHTDGVVYRVITDQATTGITVEDSKVSLTLIATGNSGNVAQYNNTIHYDFLVGTSTPQHKWFLGSQMFYY